ncbi:hypothetical protein IL54_3589 [Sphingobium sp. ba1]|nr:hypothetical protein IL54_3589 [Sphingobium sp. ba1]
MQSAGEEEGSARGSDHRAPVNLGHGFTMASLSRKTKPPMLHMR